MSAFKNGRVAGAAALCLAVLVAGSCGSREQEERGIRTPEPAASDAEAMKPGLDLGLSFSSGGAGEPSLIFLRLFSGSLRQMGLDNAAKQEGRKADIEPLRLSIPRESWAGVVFRTADRQGSSPKETMNQLAGIELVDAPATETVSIGPGDTLTAVFRISPANLPAPDTLVRAEMKIASDVIRSEAIPFPKPPDSEKGLLLRKAEIRLKLKSWREAGIPADEIIGRYPEEAAGFWLKCQALEGQGFEAEALKLYNAALEKALAHKDAGQHEPPIPIIVKIRDLEEKLSSPSIKR